MVKNRYVGRTFIQPSQTLRQRGVTVKLNPLREPVRGKRLVVVDDSIVRGTTTRQIVACCGAAGAREVHLRISAPPIYHPCFYGIDTQIETRADRVAHDRRGDPRLRRRRLAVVPVDRRRADALDLPRDRFCFACFDGHYPVPVPYDVANHKFMLEDEPAGIPVAG